MEKAMATLKESRMEQGVFIDIENDPNETGLVGSPFRYWTLVKTNLPTARSWLEFAMAPFSSKKKANIF